mmetsp:Transcript_27697/g.50026  ORF Transcript_27697/g.50026 Transcript_27697/m.50026 type:complete len:262 (-) Transcript_27697:2277-3062(-)
MPVLFVRHDKFDGEMLTVEREPSEIELQLELCVDTKYLNHMAGVRVGNEPSRFILWDHFNLVPNVKFRWIQLQVCDLFLCQLLTLLEAFGILRQPLHVDSELAVILGGIWRNIVDEPYVRVQSHCIYGTNVTSAAPVLGLSTFQNIFLPVGCDAKLVVVIQLRRAMRPPACSLEDNHAHQRNVCQPPGCSHRKTKIVVNNFGTVGIYKWQQALRNHGHQEVARNGDQGKDLARHGKVVENSCIGDLRQLAVHRKTESGLSE